MMAAVGRLPPRDRSHPLTFEKEKKMAVKAKFYVASVTRRPSGDKSPVRDVTLRPVVRGDEGKEWARWTPSGEITLTSLNERASEWFETMLGSDVLITFEGADASPEV